MTSKRQSGSGHWSQNQSQSPVSIIIDTPIHHSVRGLIGDEIFDAGLKQGIYTRRFGRTERIAQAILFLCSDQGGYIAGTALTPEGGLTWRI